MWPIFISSLALAFIILPLLSWKWHIKLKMAIADPKAVTPMLSVKGIATTFRFVENPVEPEGGA